MKKVMLLLFGVILITGCSNSKEKELCDKIIDIDVHTYTSGERYDELASILEKDYEEYCANSETNVCNALKEYIDATKSEITFKDCNNLEGDWKGLCESDNKLKVSSKKTNVIYMHEEFYTACSEVFN